MQDLLEAVNHHAAAVCMRTDATKATVMPALGKQRQTVLLDGEPLEEVDKEFKCLGSTFIANSQGIEEIRSRKQSFPIRILSPAILSLVAAYKGKDLPASNSALDSALRL